MLFTLVVSSTWKLPCYFWIRSKLHLCGFKWLVGLISFSLRGLRNRITILINDHIILFILIWIRNIFFFFATILSIYNNFQVFDKNYKEKLVAKNINYRKIKIQQSYSKYKRSLKSTQGEIAGRNTDSKPQNLEICVVAIDPGTWSPHRN